MLHRSWRTALLLWLARVPHTTAFRGAALSFLYRELVDRPRGEHEVVRNLALLSREAPVESLIGDPCLYAPEEGEVSPAVRRALAGRRGYAVVAPGSVWHTKRWHWQGYREVVRGLLERGRMVAVIGAPHERELADRVSEDLAAVNLAGCTSLDDSLWVVKQAGLMVCNDSFALQLAAAFKIPTVAVFCATSPTFGFGPRHRRAVVVEERGLACKPCRRHGGRVCPTGTEACMRFPAERVMRAVEELNLE